MAFSTREKISHVYRRLGMGAYPDLIESTETVEDAIARSLDLEQPAPGLFDMKMPLDRETATDIAKLAEPVQSWLTSMVASPRLIEERLTWIWHDHFATAVQKVRIPFLLWNQHLTIREHATGSFSDLLHAVAFDPAMLVYLDGARNHRDQINENFAREVMELHTMGSGNYTQADVTAAARSLTGWVVNVPYRNQGRQLLADFGPWEAVFVPFRHDNTPVALLGQTANHSPADVIDLLLAQPATGKFVARKLWVELVGTEPDLKTVEALATAFRIDYSTMDLVEAIVTHPMFVADTAMRSKVRSPVERLVAIAQGFGSGDIDEGLGYSLHAMSYLPFNPPSPAGYPKGRILMGPHQMVHAFDLLAVARPETFASTQELLARIGLIDVASSTKQVLESAPDNSTRTALAVNSPEFALV